MPLLLLCPDTEISPDITLTGNGSCFDTIWESGETIDQSEYDLSRLEFICESLPAGKFPDYAVSDMGCLVVSEKLKSLLQTNGVDNIEYFPATVIEHQGDQPKSGYYAANIVGLVDCIDKDKSIYREHIIGGELRGISQVEELHLEDIDLFSIQRVFLFRRLIAVRDSLKAVFEQAGISGARFILPERWDGYNGEKS